MLMIVKMAVMRLDVRQKGNLHLEPISPDEYKNISMILWLIEWDLFQILGHVLIHIFSVITVIAFRLSGFAIQTMTAVTVAMKLIVSLSTNGVNTYNNFALNSRVY